MPWESRRAGVGKENEKAFSLNLIVRARHYNGERGALPSKREAGFRSTKRRKREKRLVWPA